MAVNGSLDYESDKTLGLYNDVHLIHINNTVLFYRIIRKVLQHLIIQFNQQTTD